MVAAAFPPRCVAMSAFKVSVRTSGASPGSTIANFARPSARLATCIACPVPFCGCWSTAVAPSGSATAVTCSAWWPTTTTVSLAFSGSQARTTCSMSVRPPARCSTFARLDFKRVPFPAARTTIARSLLDMVCSPFCGSSAHFAIQGCVRRGELLIGGGGWGKCSKVGLSFGAGSLLGRDGPKGGIGQKAADELGVEGVPGFVCLHPRQKGKPRQRQVPDEVQGLMPAKFVREPQGAVHDAVFGEDNGVLQRSATNEAHSLQGLNVTLKTEGAGPRQQVPKGFWANHHLHFLLADQRMRKVHVTAHPKLLCRINPNSAVAFHDFQRLHHLKVAPFAAQLANAALLQHLHERLCRAVQNRHLDRIDVDINVVDSTGIDSSQQMLCSRQQNALFHQARRVADARDVVALRLDGEVIEVHAAKHDPCLGRRRH